MRKVAAITGAYSGLGAALSELLAKKKYALVIGGRDKKKLENFAKKIRKKVEVVPVVMDVRRKADCERFVKTAVDTFGRLDVLITNAGVLYELKPVEEVTEEEFRDTFEVNTFGVFFCDQAAIRIMKKQKNGHIINIGSTSAVDYKSSHSAYGASKSAVIGLTGCLQKELVGTGVKITVFNPGGMKTDLFRKQPGRSTEGYMEPAFVAERILEHIESNSDEWNVVLRRPGA